MPNISLLSLVLTLRPLHPLTDVPHLGRAAHALLLDAVRWTNPALAEQLHTGSDLRPFTVSDVIGVPRKVGLLPERTYPLRFTALTAAVAQALLRATLTPTLSRDDTAVTGEGVTTLTPTPSAASPDQGEGSSGPLSPGSTIELGPARFRIEAVDAGDGFPPEARGNDVAQSEIQNQRSKIQHHPWAQSMTYEDLSAPWLLGRETPARFIWMQFVSPTMFKVEGRHLPVPLPEQVFGSLLEKWNAFAPVVFPPEARRYAKECLALSSYELRSRGAMLKEGGLRMGAVGRARYVATNFDRYWMSLVQTAGRVCVLCRGGRRHGHGPGAVQKDCGLMIADCGLRIEIQNPERESGVEHG